jgi:hypothetical protein
MGLCNLAIGAEVFETVGFGLLGRVVLTGGAFAKAASGSIMPQRAKEWGPTALALPLASRCAKQQARMLPLQLQFVSLITTPLSAQGRACLSLTQRLQHCFHASPNPQVKVGPSRIPAYKSPTKVSKGQQQQQAAQSAQQQQLTQIKAHSRIPQPQVTRKSLPDAEQAGSSCDQTPERERISSSGGASATPGPASGTTAGADAGKPAPGTTASARIAALQRGAAPANAPAAAAPTPASNSAAAVRGGGGLVAAAAAAFEGGASQGPVAVGPRASSRTSSASSSGGGGASGPAAGTSGPVVKPNAGVCPPGHRSSSAGGCAVVSKPLESFVPLDLDDPDEDLLQPSAAPPQAPQQQLAQQQQQVSAAAAARERLSHSGSSSSSLMARGSGGRVHKSLLQLEPSRWVLASGFPKSICAQHGAASKCKRLC